MTLGDLALDVYRRLDYADSPPPSVKTRVEGFLNTHYVRLLSTDRMRPLRETTVTLVTTPHQSVYVLPTTVARVQRVTDVSGRHELQTKPLEWYRRVNPVAHIAGTPDTWVPTTTQYQKYTLTLHPTPTTALTYSVDIEHPIIAMDDDTDVPELLPEDFHDLLALLARADEYEFKSDDRWAATKAQAERRLMELRQWVDNHDVYRRSALPEERLQAYDGSPSAGLSAGTGGAGEPHSILSPTHPDTVPGTLLGGDLLKANAAGLLDRLPLGPAGAVLTVQLGVPTWVSPASGAGTGDVVGPASSVTGAVATYADATGKLIDDSPALITPAGDLILPARLVFESETVDQPALKSASPLGLEVRTGDDSGYAALHVANLVTDAGLYEHGRTVPMGEYIIEPWNAANFWGHDAMTWTVEASDFVYVNYTLIGKSMFLAFQINTSSIGGTLSSLLHLKIPGGFFPSQSIIGTACYIRNGAGGLKSGYCATSFGYDNIIIAKVDETNYVASSHGTYVYANIVFPILLP